MSFSVTGGQYLVNHPDDEGGGLLYITGASTIDLDIEWFAGDALGAVLVDNAAAVISITADSLEVTSGGNVLSMNGGSVTMTLESASSNAGSCLSIAGGTLNATISGELFSAGGECIAPTGGTSNITAGAMHGEGNVEVVTFQGGDCTITCSLMEVFDSSTGTIRIAGPGDGTLHIIGADITNTHATMGAFNVEGTPTGSKAVILENCDLVSTSAKTMNADSAFTVCVRGEVTTTGAIDSDLSFTCSGRVIEDGVEVYNGAGGVSSGAIYASTFARIAVSTAGDLSDEDEGEM